MGYSYTMSGALCCDSCPASGKAAGVRKRKCPYGYCPSPALCTTCYNTKEKPGRKERHVACKARMEASAAKAAAEAAIVEAGGYVRCSALGKDGDTVHVLFRGKADIVGYYMSASTYRAFPLGELATPEDFAKVGPITTAPANFF